MASNVLSFTPPSASSNATSTWLGYPDSLAVDAAGNIYFTSLHCVFRLSASGALTRFAGNGRKGFLGDGGQAAAAQLNSPAGVAFDASGNVYIADSLNHRIRRVSSDGVIVTVAGSGVEGNTGDGGPAVAATLDTPVAVAVTQAGALLVLDFGNNRVRQVSRAGVIAPFAGSGAVGSAGDGGTALSAQFRFPTGMALSSSGDLYLADAGNNVVRRISAAGIVSTVAGTGIAGYIGDGDLATSANLNFPDGVSLDSAGNLYISDSENFRVRRVTPAGIISTVAGVGTQGFGGDGGAATSAALHYPNDVAVSTTGALVIADSGNSRIRAVSSAGIISTIAGGGSGPSINSPDALAVDTAGVIYATDSFANRVLSIAKNGTIAVVAGDGTRGFSGDSAEATSAQLSSPLGVAVRNGVVYVADTGNQRIRQIAANKTITTIAGTGVASFSGDGAAATSATLSFPGGIAVDASGNLYVADTGNNRIRRISPSGTISTYAGNGTAGFSGDGGVATGAALSGPTSVAVDATGNLFIADTVNGRVRRVTPGGVISTVAAGLKSPGGISVDAAGNVYLAETRNHTIFRIGPGTTATIGGSGLHGYSGDGGPASLAQLSLPLATVVDSDGRVVFADSGNGALRALQLTNSSVVVAAVSDAASGTGGAIARGKIVVIYGSGMGPAQLTLFPSTVTTLPTSLAGTSVSFNGTPAPIIYTSANQVAAIVPYGLTGSTATVTVGYQTQLSSAFPTTIATTSPGIFTANSSGTGQAAAINAATGALNTASTPAKQGEYVALFATGEGLTTAPSDGKLAGLPLPGPLATVSAKVGGIPTPVQYAGGVFGTVAGLMQVNVLVPPDAPVGGYVPVSISVGGVESPTGVWISVAAKP